MNQVKSVFAITLNFAALGSCLVGLFRNILSGYVHIAYYGSADIVLYALLDLLCFVTGL